MKKLIFFPLIIFLFLSVLGLGASTVYAQRCADGLDPSVECCAGYKSGDWPNYCQCNAGQTTAIPNCGWYAPSIPVFGSVSQCSGGCSDPAYPTRCYDPNWQGANPDYLYSCTYSEPAVTPPPGPPGECEYFCTDDPASINFCFDRGFTHQCGFNNTNPSCSLANYIICGTSLEACDQCLSGIIPPPFPNPTIVPPANYTPCNATDPDFHSLRPYPQSPCDLEIHDTALFCGNDITILQSIGITKSFDNPASSWNYGGQTPDIPIDNLGNLPCRYCQNGGCVNNSGDPSCNAGLTMCADNFDCIGSCQNNADGTETCSFTLDNESVNIAIDLSDAELPIMGFTEPSENNLGRTNKVANRLNPLNLSNPSNTETISDADKVNEYVSWYLNGVNERAEGSYLSTSRNCIGETTGKTGVCLSTVNSNLCSINAPLYSFDGDAACAEANTACCVFSPTVQTELDRDKLINYSGPIKKLLPIRRQHEERIEQVEDATASVNDDANIRHNQIAGCTYGLQLPSVFGGVVYGGFPLPCYIDGALGAIITLFRDEQRLTNWIDPDDLLPPLEENEPTWLSYITKYREWRGDVCAALPFELFGLFDFYLCIDNPITLEAKANFWSNIFTYIPFTSTEDRLGQVKVETATIQLPISSEFRILNATISSQDTAELYFAHMEESNQLGRILQQTFAPSGAALKNMTDSGYVPPNNFCDLTEIRTNPGDDLYAGELSVTLNYTAQIDATFTVPEIGAYSDPNYNIPTDNLCNNYLGGECVANPNTIAERRFCDTVYGQVDCSSTEACSIGCDGGFDSNDDTTCQAVVFSSSGGCVPNDWTGTGCISFDSSTNNICAGNYKCVANVNDCSSPANAAIPSETFTTQLAVTMNTITETPLVDTIWARLVAGTNSVFRRFFPRVGEGGAIEGIWDIPAATGVNYSYDGNDPSISVQAGNPGTLRDGAGAELYFPHIGGIKEYFLTGIQTLLRPKGYGNQILQSEPPLGTGTGVCDQVVPPPPVAPLPVAGGSCSPGVLGWCSIATLTNQINGVRGLNWSTTQITNAAIICNGESAGLTNAFNDGCLCNQSVDYSLGLFQVNLLAHCAASAFTYTWSPPSCTILNQSLVDQCSFPPGGLWDPQVNIDYMINISNNGTNWSPWSVAGVCGIS